MRGNFSLVLAVLALPGFARAGGSDPAGTTPLAQAPTYPYYGTYYPQGPVSPYSGYYPQSPGYAPPYPTSVPRSRGVPIDPYATPQPQLADPYAPYAAPAPLYVAAAQPTRLQPADPYAASSTAAGARTQPSAPSPLADPYSAQAIATALATTARPVDPYAASPSPTRATLRPTTTDEDAAAAVLGCIDAFEVDHVEAARTGCALALVKDPGLALAHLYAARVAEDHAAFRHELTLAASTVAHASLGERLFVAGYLKWQAGSLDAAGRAYDQLVAAYPDAARAWLWRGQFRLATGDAAGAADDLAKAIALDESSAAARRYQGLALGTLGKNEPALVALRDYARLAPSEPNPHYELARALLRSGQATQAAAEAHKALDLDADYLPAYASLGDALLASGKPRQARQAYAKLLDAPHERPELRHDGALRIARSLLAEGRITEAERAFTDEAKRARALDHLLESAEAFLCAARSQLLRGASIEAQRALQQTEAALHLATTHTAASRAVGVGVLSRPQLEDALRVARLQFASGF